MYQSEIKDLQDMMKKWNRFRITCKHRNNMICEHAILGGGIHCSVHLCPGGKDEPKGTRFHANMNGPFIG